MCVRHKLRSEQLVFFDEMSITGTCSSWETKIQLVEEKELLLMENWLNDHENATFVYCKFCCVVKAEMKVQVWSRACTICNVDLNFRWIDDVDTSIIITQWQGIVHISESRIVLPCLFFFLFSMRIFWINNSSSYQYPHSQLARSTDSTHWFANSLLKNLSTGLNTNVEQKS